MNGIPQRRFGRTDLSVTELGLGGFQFTGEFGVPRSEACAILDTAFAAGINFIDTAPMYGYGESEELVGRALARSRARVIVSTKVGRLDRTIVRHARDAAYRDEGLLYRVIEHSLHLLGREYLEVVMIHEPEWPQWGMNPRTGDAPVMRVLETLKRNGVIGAIGLGGMDCDFMAGVIETGRIDVVLNFMHYDLAVRDARDRLLPAAKRHDVGVILGGPFRQGALAVKQPAVIEEMRRTGGYRYGFNREVVQRIDAIYALSDETGMDLAEMGIRYLLSDPQVSTVIPGPRSVAQLEQNLAAAAQGPLPPEVFERVEQIAQAVGAG